MEKTNIKSCQPHTEGQLVF